MMEIRVSLLEEGKLAANLGEFKIIAQDRRENSQFPEPYDYFEAASALCAAFYLRAFFEGRNLSTEGLEISQLSKSNPDNKYEKEIILKVRLPTGFPGKYLKVVEAAVKGCTVKKVVEAGPKFLVEIEEASLS